MQKQAQTQTVTKKRRGAKPKFGKRMRLFALLLTVEQFAWVKSHANASETVRQAIDAAMRAGAA